MRYLLSDKATTPSACGARWAMQGLSPSSRARHRKRAIRYDKDRYHGRHLIETAFCCLKDFRRLPTRYDKLAANFL